MFVPEIQDASSEIILAIHLNGIRDPRPHNYYCFMWKKKCRRGRVATSTHPKQHKRRCTPMRSLVEIKNSNPKLKFYWPKAWPSDHLSCWFVKHVLAVKRCFHQMIVLLEKVYKPLFFFFLRNQSPNKVKWKYYYDILWFIG